MSDIEYGFAMFTCGVVTGLVIALLLWLVRKRLEPVEKDGE